MNWISVLVSICIIVIGYHDDMKVDCQMNSTTAPSDYCSLFGKTHTLCQYKGNGTKCRPLYRFGVDESQRRQIVDFHNRCRAFLANGKERRGRPGPQPAAGDMKQMTYDDELATIAQRYAEQCIFMHDTNRRVVRFQVGQSLYVKMQTARDDRANWKEAIKAWYDEVRFQNRNEVQRYRAQPKTGHYTALIWSTTNKVGCGYSSFKDSTNKRFPYQRIYVCNYGPGGNIEGFPVYKSGSACSVCGTNCSTSYPGLCLG